MVNTVVGCGVLLTGADHRICPREISSYLQTTIGDGAFGPSPAKVAPRCLRLAHRSRCQAMTSFL
jgi:hypothetical protein